MELLFEFIFEILFEGILEVIKSNKVKLWIRITLFILISSFFIILFGILTYLVFNTEGMLVLKIIMGGLDCFVMYFLGKFLLEFKTPNN